MDLGKNLNLREEKAVTLTALVITIIVLIILAAVSVIGVFGENGIFKSAITAKVDTETAAYTEELKAIEVQTRTQQMKSNSEFVYLNAFENNVRNNYMFKEAREIEQKSGNTMLRIVTKEGYIFYIADDETQGVISGGVIGEVEEPVDLVEGENVTFSYDDSTWTKGPKDVTINLQNVESKQQLQYSIDGKNWSNCESGVVVKMTTIGNVYARLHNGVIGGGVAKAKIEKIDTLKPNSFVPEVYTTADTITIKASTTDAAATSKSGSSGIAKYEYSKNGGTDWVAGGTEYTFTEGLVAGETYKIVVRVTDNAGNTYETAPINKATVPLPDLSDGSDGKPANLSISCNPSTYTNKNVTVTVSTTENLSAYGFKLEYSIDGGTTYAEYTKPFELEKNGKVLVAVSNGNGKYGKAFEKTVDWIDKLEPEKVEVSVTGKTSSTITVNVNAEDAKATSEYASSGIKVYKYSCDGGATWTEEKGEASYTFTKLTQDTVYPIQVEVIDKAENSKKSQIISGPETKTEKVDDAKGDEIDPSTGEVIKIGDIGFTYYPNTWTNGDVIVYVENRTTNNYTLQYSIGNPKVDSNWKDYNASSGVTFTENGAIYVRFYDGTNGSKNYATGNVTNIDKLAPSDFQVSEDLAGRTTSTIRVTTPGTTDRGGSGIAGYYYSYSIDNGNTWIDDTETIEEKSHTFINLHADTYYKIKVTAVDNAGNETEALVKTEVKTKVIPTITPGTDDGNDGVIGGTVAFVYNTKEWTKENVTVRLNVDPTIKAEYETQWKTDENESWTNYSQSPNITLTKNGKVYVRFTDGINPTDEISDEVTWIDKLTPTDIIPVIKDMTSAGLTISGSSEDRTSTTEYGKSGLSKYVFQVYNENTLVESKEVEVSNDNEEKQVIFSGLEQGIEYTIKAVAIDKAGNTSSGDTNAVKQEYTTVKGFEQGDVIFNYEPSTWTNGVVMVTATIKESVLEGYIAQYSTTGNKNDWHEYTNRTPIEFTKNGTLRIRLFDGEAGGIAAIGNVQNIDKLNPNDDFEINVLSKSSNKIKLEVSSTDAEGNEEYGCSGIKKYYFSVDNGVTWLPSLEYGDEIEGVALEEGQTKVEYTIENLTNNTEYVVKVKAVDKVENERISSENTSKTIKTDKIPDLTDEDKFDEDGNKIPKNVEFSYNPSTRWAKQVEVTVKILDNEILEKYKVQYKANDMTDFADATVEGADGNEVKIVATQNGRVYVRLSDGTSGGAEARSKEIDWIDSVAPTIEKFEVIGEPTKTSITVEALAGDTQSGLKSTPYQFSCDGGTTWLPEGGTSERTYIFTGLTPSTEYDLRVKATDNIGNEGTSSILKETDGIPVVNLDRDIRYKFSNTDETGEQYWTNEDVTLIVEVLNDAGIDWDLYSLWYQVPGQEAKISAGVGSIETITISEYGKTLIWLEDFEGNKGAVTTFPEALIDVDKPESFTPEVVIRTHELTVSAPIGMPRDKEGTEDIPIGSSGMKQEWWFSKDNGINWEKDSATTSFTFNGLDEGTEYNLVMRVFDKAGNYRDCKVNATTRSIITIEDADFTFTYTPDSIDTEGNKVYTNGRVTVKAEITNEYKKELIKTGYTMKYRANGEGEWKDYNPTAGVPLAANGYVTFKLVDNLEGYDSHGTGTANVVHIDKDKPSVTQFPTEVTLHIGASCQFFGDFEDEGVSGIDSYLISQNNKEYNSANANWIEFKSTEVQTVNSIQGAKTVDGGVEMHIATEASAPTEEKWYLWVKDKAGNISNCYDITATVEGNSAFLVDEANLGDYVDIGISYVSQAVGFTGWRVLSKTGSGSTGTVSLVSAGIPLMYYHYDYNKSISDLGSMYKTLTAGGNPNQFSASGFEGGTYNLKSVFDGGLRVVDVTKGVHAFETSELCVAYDVLMGTSGTTFGNLQNKYMTDPKLGNLLNISYQYWLAGKDCGWYVGQNGFIGNTIRYSRYSCCSYSKAWSSYFW